MRVVADLSRGKILARMQGQRSSIDSYPETFEFDRRSGSNNTGAEQQLFWNNVIDPIGSQLPEYQLPANDTNFTFANAIGNDERRLSSWAFGESSSSPTSGNQISNNDEAKTDNQWSLLSGTHNGVGPRLEGRQCDTTNIVSSGSANLNLSGHQIANGPLFLQSSSSDHICVNADLNAGYGGNNVDQVNDTSFYPHLYEPGVSEIEQRPYAGGSTNFSGAASGSTGHMTEEVDGMPGCSLDNRRLSCKRKALEGVSGQSSGSGTPSRIHQAENTIWNSPPPPQYNVTSGLQLSSLTDSSSGGNPPGQLNRRLSVGTRVVSDNHSDVEGNVENSQRNFHARTPSNLPSTGTYIRHLYTQSSSRAPPFSHSLDLRPITASTASSLASRNMQPLLWNGAFGSRAGSSSSSQVASAERIALQREVSSRSISGNNLEHGLFVSTTETRNLDQDPRHWSLANVDLVSPANAASSSQVRPSSGVHPSPAPTAISHQSPPSHHLRISEGVRRSLFASSGSEFGGQSRNFSPQLIGLSTSSQDVLPSGTGRLGHHQPRHGSALQMDRRQLEGVIRVPMPSRPLAAASEGRSRLVSEIRNVLDFMRRGGEGFRFEDVFNLEQSIFYGVNDLHDRHRDMRLDVDNMTYEELLALEERIGNVSTGLNEETIAKFLKQRKYLSMLIEPHSELEPCCICQEEYADGNYLGVLDCGHVFHALCIKQWLAHKNLCPICKTTALIT